MGKLILFSKLVLKFYPINELGPGVNNGQADEGQESEPHEGS